MTYKEANYMIDDITWSYDGKSVTKDDIIECRETCHKALEKQIPRKAILDVIYPSGIEWYLCPTCNHNNIEKSDSYCHACGQALDWGEDEC